MAAETADCDLDLLLDCESVHSDDDLDNDKTGRKEEAGNICITSFKHDYGAQSKSNTKTDPGPVKKSDVREPNRQAMPTSIMMNRHFQADNNLTVCQNTKGTSQKSKAKKKKRITSYSVFVKEKRIDVIKQLGTSDLAAISPKIGEMWTQLTPLQKQVWRRKATQLQKINDCTDSYSTTQLKKINDCTDSYSRYERQCGHPAPIKTCYICVKSIKTNSKSAGRCAEKQIQQEQKERPLKQHSVMPEIILNESKSGATKTVAHTVSQQQSKDGREILAESLSSEQEKQKKRIYRYQAQSKVKGNETENLVSDEKHDQKSDGSATTSLETPPPGEEKLKMSCDVTPIDTSFADTRNTTYETNSKATENLALKNKKLTKKCGDCPGCLRTRCCGKCDYCMDKVKFGGPNKLKRRCRLQQCLQYVGKSVQAKKTAVKVSPESANNSALVSSGPTTSSATETSLSDHDFARTLPCSVTDSIKLSLKPEDHFSDKLVSDQAQDSPETLSCSFLDSVKVILKSGTQDSPKVSPDMPKNSSETLASSVLDSVKLILKSAAQDSARFSPNLSQDSSKTLACSVLDSVRLILKSGAEKSAKVASEMYQDSSKTLACSVLDSVKVMLKSGAQDSNNKSPVLGQAPATDVPKSTQDSPKILASSVQDCVKLILKSWIHDSQSKEGEEERSTSNESLVNSPKIPIVTEPAVSSTNSTPGKIIKDVSKNIQIQQLLSKYLELTDKFKDTRNESKIFLVARSKVSNNSSNKGIVSREADVSADRLIMNEVKPVDSGKKDLDVVMVDSGDSDTSDIELCDVPEIEEEIDDSAASHKYLKGQESDAKCRRNVGITKGVNSKRKSFNDFINPKSNGEVKDENLENKSVKTHKKSKRLKIQHNSKLSNKVKKVQRQLLIEDFTKPNGTVKKIYRGKELRSREKESDMKTLNASANDHFKDFMKPNGMVKKTYSEKELRSREKESDMKTLNASANDHSKVKQFRKKRLDSVKRVPEITNYNLDNPRRSSRLKSRPFTGFHNKWKEIMERNEDRKKRSDLLKKKLKDQYQMLQEKQKKMETAGKTLVLINSTKEQMTATSIQESSDKYKELAAREKTTNKIRQKGAKQLKVLDKRRSSELQKHDNSAVVPKVIRNGLTEQEKLDVTEMVLSEHQRKVVNQKTEIKPVRCNWQWKRRRRCNNCVNCRRETNCGKCVNCLDMRQFGGPGVKKQKCRLRQCVKFQESKPLKKVQDKTENDNVPKAKKLSRDKLKAESNSDTGNIKRPPVSKHVLKNQRQSACLKAKENRMKRLRESKKFDARHLTQKQISDNKSENTGKKRAFLHIFETTEPNINLNAKKPKESKIAKSVQASDKIGSKKQNKSSSKNLRRGAYNLRRAKISNFKDLLKNPFRKSEGTEKTGPEQSHKVENKSKSIGMGKQILECKVDEKKLEVEKTLHENEKEGNGTIIIENVKKQRQKPMVRRCRNCSNCQRKANCGKCKHCKDMRVFGGPGTLKQKCLLKQCKSLPILKKPASLHSVDSPDNPSFQTGNFVLEKGLPEDGSRLEDVSVKDIERKIKLETSETDYLPLLTNIAGIYTSGGLNERSIFIPKWDFGREIQKQNVDASSAGANLVNLTPPTVLHSEMITALKGQGRFAIHAEPAQVRTSKETLRSTSIDKRAGEMVSGLDSLISRTITDGPHLVPVKPVGKKKSGTYNLFYSVMSKAQLSENSQLDARALNKKIKGLWQNLSSRDKLVWKREARRQAQQSNKAQVFEIEMINDSVDSVSSDTNGNSAGGNSSDNFIEIATWQGQNSVSDPYSSGGICAINSDKMKPPSNEQLLPVSEIKPEPMDVTDCDNAGSQGGSDHRTSQNTGSQQLESNGDNGSHEFDNDWLRKNNIVIKKEPEDDGFETQEKPPSMDNPISLFHRLCVESANSASKRRVSNSLSDGSNVSQLSVSQNGCSTNSLEIKSEPPD